MIYANRYRVKLSRFFRRGEDLAASKLKNEPVRHNRCIAMYLDDEALPTIRVLVYGFPNSDSVFCGIETLDNQFQVVKNAESGIYDTLEQLEEDLELKKLIPVEVPEMAPIVYEEE